MPLLNAAEVSSFIPQKDPFVLIDSLIDHDASFSVSGFTIPEVHVLIEDACLSEAGLLENIAQTCAIHSGYQFKKRMENASDAEKKNPPVGFIGSVSRAQIYKRPAVGVSLNTRVDFMNQVMNASVIKGRVFEGEELLAEAEMMIFLQE